MTDDDEDLRVTATCPECGTEHEVTLPERPVTEKAGSMMRAMAARLYCDECMEKEEAKDREKAEREERERFARRLEKSNIPPTFRRYRWTDWDEESPTEGKAVKSAKLWVTEGGLLTLQGPPGRGKSALAATSLMALLLRGVPGQWVSVSALLQDLRRGFGDERRGAAADVLTQGGPLVLDDLDKASASPFALEAVFTAIDSRVQSGERLLITKNLGLRDLGNKLGEEYGEPIVSRIVSGAYHEMSGPDRRAQR